MISSDYQWLLLQLLDGERLYRVRMSSEGVVSLPEVGVVQIKSSSNGGYTFLSSQGELNGSLFSDGAALYRRSPTAAPKVPSPQRKGKLPLIVMVASGLFLLTKWIPNGVANTAPAKPKKNTPAAVAATPVRPTVTPTPQPTATPTVQPTPLPTPKAVVTPAIPKKEVMKSSPFLGPKLIDWPSIEKNARGAFFRGEWARAEGLLIDLPMKKALGAPDSVRSLAAEIHYARCQRAFNAQDFKGAAEACQKAIEIYHNARAYALLRQLSERARRLYLEGYVMEGSNREAAIRRYREVIETAPAKDPFRAKAAKKLKVIVASTED